MSNEPSTCSVCGTSFVPELTYQVEERVIVAEDSSRYTEKTYYCSLECVNRSHESGEFARCDVCGKSFVIELVSQVINRRGRRHHACSGTCRQHLLGRLNGPTLRAVAPTLPNPPALAPAPAMGATTAPPRTAATPSVSPKATPLPTAAEATPSVDMATDDTQWRRIQATLDGRTQVIAVFNHKGGTGKTTTAVTVAAGLASKGRKVLLVDTDGQGNVGVSLGVQNERTLYHVLVMGLDPKEAIVEVRPNLHVLPANETIAAAELFLAGRQRRDRVLATRLASMREQYDVIVVDCSPSLSLMNQNALVFADGVLCPVACDYLSLVGVRQVMKTIKQVNRLLSHPVRLWGVLPTLYDARARVCVEAYDTLRKHFGDRCLAPIRMASRAKEAPSQAQTLFEYAPDATATKDYWQVVDLLYEDSATGATSNVVAMVGGVK